MFTSIGVFEFCHNFFFFFLLVFVTIVNFEFLQYVFLVKKTCKIFFCKAKMLVVSLLFKKNSKKFVDEKKMSEKVFGELSFMIINA